MHIHSGVPKSFITTGAGTYPATVDANQTIYVTDIVNVDTTAAGATIRDGGSGGDQLMIVPASSTSTLDAPLKVTKGNTVYINRANVSVGYFVAGGAATTGPNGYPWNQTTDTLAGPFNYSY